MKDLVSILLIGISLSMDTFSLSLSIGTIFKNNKYLYIFPLLVGMFHFIMPIFGNFLGIKVINIFNIATNILLGLILIILGINLAIHYFEDENLDINLSILSTLALALSVSLDSFTIGFGMSDITSNYFLSSLAFSFCSASFTSLGLILGKYGGKIIGKYANILGIALLIILGIYHLV